MGAAGDNRYPARKHTLNSLGSYTWSAAFALATSMGSQLVARSSGELEAKQFCLSFWRSVGYFIAFGYANRIGRQGLLDGGNTLENRQVFCDSGLTNP